MGQPTRIISFAESGVMWSHPEGETAGKTGRQGAVLIADDERDTLEICTLSLRGAGYRVLVAEDGRTALHLARTELPDLILMDLRLPGVDGLTVAELLKSSPHTAGIPVLAYTIHDRAVDYQRAREAGFDGYLVKPCTNTELVKLVARIIGHGAPDADAVPEERIAAD